MLDELGHTLVLEHLWEHTVFDFPDEKEFSSYTVMTWEIGTDYGVYKNNGKQYTVTYGRVVYPIAIYCYL